MNICGEIRSRLYRLIMAIIGEEPEVRAERVMANITYYGDRGVRPHRSTRSQARKRRSG